MHPHEPARLSKSLTILESRTATTHLPQPSVRVGAKWCARSLRVIAIETRSTMAAAATPIRAHSHSANVGSKNPARERHRPIHA
jgi:hypothetical protein